MTHHSAVSPRWTMLRHAPSFFIFLNALALTVCIFIRWPRWWVHVIYGTSALNWWASVQLSWIAVIVWMIAALSEKEDRTGWAALGGGFLFLSLEEHFRFHVHIREQILKPLDIATHLPIVGPGDIVLLVYAAFGLAASVWIIRRMQKVPKAALWFKIAVAASVIGVTIDAVDYHSWDLLFFRKVSFVEEVFERSIAVTSFLVAFTLYLLRLMDISE